MKRSGLTILVVLSVLMLAIMLTSCTKFMPITKRNEAEDDRKEIQESYDANNDEKVEANKEIVDQKESIDIINEEELNEGGITTEEVQMPEGASEADSFDYSMDSSELSNESFGWSFKRNSNHEPVIGYNQGINLEKYEAYYRVNTDEKVIYLTFDEGYENGYTSKILDILKENEVQAAFFVTKPYIESSTDLCIRMVEEGHVVANHSVTHSSFPTLTNEQIKEELMGTAEAFYEATGYEMAPFFRPPSGNFSERVLNEVRKEGYNTVFWSLAYADWDVNKQPGAEYVYNHIMENHHPGGIFLLHAVSQSNTEALDDVLKALKAEGYRFGSLYELE